MATATRAPTGDEAVSGTWTGSAGTRWQSVDDYPDTVPTDFLDHGTTAGNITFSFSVFSIPAGSTSISVQVQYYDRDVSSGANNFGGRLKVGGNYYNASTHNPSNTLTQVTDNWATNPKTTTAWTVDDINGVGSNALQAFGAQSSDANPALRISSIQVQVTYTVPLSGTVAKTLGSVTRSIAGQVEVHGTVAKTLGSVARSITGQVEVRGAVSRTVSASVVSAGQLVSAENNGTVAKTLDAVSCAAVGQIEVVGAAAQTLAAVTSSIAGQVEVRGAATQTLGAVTPSIIGRVDVRGTSALLVAASVAATGTVGGREGQVAATLASVAVASEGAHFVSGVCSLQVGVVVVSTAIVPQRFQSSTNQTTVFFDPSVFDIAIQRRNWLVEILSRVGSVRLIGGDPVSSSFQIKEGDRVPSLMAQLLDENGSPLNISGAASVTFRMRAKKDVLVSGLVQIDDSANGLVSYAWAVDDTSRRGIYQVEFEIDWGGGLMQTLPTSAPLTVEVLSRTT